MTIIAVKDGIMCADSFSFVGEIGRPLADGDAKIIRAPDGSLVGACGSSSDCYQLGLWVKDGMDFKKPPKFTFEATADNSVYWLWLRADGIVLAGDANMRLHPVATPEVCGSAGAGDMALGAMLFGASAEEAVRLCVERCNSVGGEVQIERLD